LTGRVRPAQGRDAAAIAAIMAPFARETTITFTSHERSPAEISAALGQHPWLVWEALGGTVTGYAALSLFRTGPGYARVREVSIGLSPSARGKGQGRALMAALEAAARRQGITALLAAISGENPGAQAFHAACGFDPVGLLPGVGYKFGRRLDLVLMQKDLSPAERGG